MTGFRVLWSPSLDLAFRGQRCQDSHFDTGSQTELTAFINELLCQE